MPKSISIEKLNIVLPNQPMPCIRVVPKGHPPNYKLMRYIIQLIKLNPDHWNQHEWRCGTSFCFAGFVDLIAAYQHDKNTLASNFTVVKTSDRFNPITLVRNKYYKKLWKEYGFDMQYLTLDNTSQLFLGIYNVAKDRLFNASNNIEDLENIIEIIKTTRHYWT